MNPAMDSVQARRELSPDEFERPPAHNNEAHPVSVGGFGPSIGVASDMAYGAVSPAEQALQMAARTYLGDAHDWTDVMLLGGGAALASLRVVRAARHIPAVVARLGDPKITNSYDDLIRTYRHSLAELSQLRRTGAIGPALWEDFSRYIKEAFQQAFHNSIVPGVQADSAFRHAESLKMARKVPDDVANKLARLVKAVCNRGNWRGKPPR